MRCLLLLLVVSSVAAAQPRSGDAGDLVVAVSPSPPFVTQSADGTWGGLGAAFAGEVGQVLGRPVRFVAVPPDRAAAALASGAADVAVVPAREGAEAGLDLTTPFVTARLGAARTPDVGIVAVAGRFLSPTFFWVAGGLAVLLLVVGVAIWLFERHQEEDDFREDRAGIWDGFWWAGVTMTTIGYGDTVPTSVGGRTLALSWMLVSMVLTAALTTALVSALGLGEGSRGLTLPGDLDGERVGVAEGSAAAGALAELGVRFHAFPSVANGLAAVESDSIDVFVGSVPRLRAALPSGSSLRIEASERDLERWTLAVADGSPLREPLARAVLTRLHSADWPETVRRYTEP